MFSKLSSFENFEKFTLVLSEKKIASAQCMESLHTPYYRIIFFSSKSDSLSPGKFFAGQFFAHFFFKQSGQFFALQFFARTILRWAIFRPDSPSPDNCSFGQFFDQKILE
jgi:hypothetical protein